MAGTEEMDQAVGGDGVGAPFAGGLDGRCLRPTQPLQQLLRLGQPGQRRSADAGRAHAATSAGVVSSDSSASSGSQWPLRIERYAASTMRLTT